MSLATQAVDAELRVDGLVKRYSPSVTVGPITFDVRPGEYLSLLGPSGCGKTTTLRCIAGFETPTEGTIHLAGERLDTKPAHRRGVGLVFQNYALFPHLSVAANVAFGLRIARVGRAEMERRVAAMLDLVGLSDARDRLPSQLSGGQQQRVAIARAVVMEPRVILFDEPLSNLDHKLRLQMRRELRELQRRLGKTTIYVTHDQTEALALSDRIAVLSRGRIEQIGSPKDIYERPATPFVAEFIGSANLFPAIVVARKDGAVTVEIGQDLRLMVDDDRVSDTDKVLLMLRPERLQLALGGDGTDGTPAENRLQGIVTDLTYLGEDLALVVKVSGRLELTVTAKTSARTRDLAPGRHVELSVAASDVHLLRQ